MRQQGDSHIRGESSRGSEDSLFIFTISSLDLTCILQVTYRNNNAAGVNREFKTVSNNIDSINKTNLKVKEEGVHKYQWPFEIVYSTSDDKVFILAATYCI